VPSNRRYRLELSPSSAKREHFPPLFIYLDIVSGSGIYNPYRHPFSTALCVCIFILLILNCVAMAVRLILLNRKVKLAESIVKSDGEKVPFNTDFEAAE
jgi:hypothetical protein